MRFNNHTYSRRKTAPLARRAMAMFTGLFLVAMGCQEEPISTESVARPVKIMVIERQSASNILEYPGKVSPAQESYMAFEVPGRITSFPVKEGQTVRKGTILAKLDPRDFEADYAATLARLRQAKAEYQRYAALYEARNTSLSELQVKQRAFEVQQAKVRQAKKALQDTKLIAPFPGKIAKKLVEDFQNVQAKEPVLILQDTSSLEIIFNVPEGDLVAGRPELTVAEANARIKSSFTLSSLPGRAFPARAKEFSTTADPVTRTFEITLAFDPPRDVRILPGMTATVNLKRTKGKTDFKDRNLFRVPANAVGADEKGESFVWRINPESMTAHRQSVKVGTFSEKDQIEVNAGLARGDWIAVTGVHHLREGMKVRRLEGSPK